MDEFLKVIRQDGTILALKSWRYALLDVFIKRRRPDDAGYSFSLDVEVQQLIDDYGTSATQATLYRLAEEVCQNLGISKLAAS
ncbi:hypothetical protein GQ600_9287 [Phytophthora cactorum]|nr:hypothetical protein GQ600_9287 [Phytophthora cactorum]